MIQTVKGESNLPTAPGTRLWQYFLRSISDPTLLIEGHTGEVFRRNDGAKWEQPAYERSGTIDRRTMDATWDDLSPKAAWFDSAVYPYAKKAAA